ncbi:hypothetical protein M0R45_036303 [Rubus argutus]|uniref:Secreted protein n=1 Tax=Rubus argutus TaxID=59490 RepID=A0AAW1VZU2_RUBAR
MNPFFLFLFVSSSWQRDVGRWCGLVDRAAATRSSDAKAWIGGCEWLCSSRAAATAACGCDEDWIEHGQRTGHLLLPCFLFLFSIFGGGA